MMKVFTSKRMKSYLFLLLMAIAYGQAMAQSNGKGNIQISGKALFGKPRALVLTGPNRFNKDIEVKGGLFALKLSADTGFFMLDRYSVYLEPGFDIQVILRDSSITFNGKGSTENQLYSDLSALIGKYLPFDGTNLSSRINEIQPHEFLARMDDYQSEALKKIGNSNVSGTFRTSQEEYIRNLVRYYLKYYDDNYGIDPEKRKEFLSKADLNRKGIEKVTPAELMRLGNEMRVKRMSPAEHKEFQKMIWDNFDLNNGRLYKFSPSYRNLVDKRLSMLVKDEQRISGTKKHEQEVRIEVAEKNISNKFIKEEMLYNATTALLKYRVGNLERVYNAYAQKSTDPENLINISKLYNSINNAKALKRSPDFVFSDMAGNMIRLSDFSDSYVYLDLWATWCAPCIKELPDLKKLAEKYKGQNIKIISISIDKEEDQQKLKDFVKTNDAPGIQLMASRESEFIKGFDIRSIPRYILLGPNGTVISEDAPRPSDIALIAILDKSLVAGKDSAEKVKANQ